VTPSIDTTTYAQAAALNKDGSHGPLKCGTCHDVGSGQIPRWVDDLEYRDPITGQRTRIAGNFDAAVSWMHTYTDEASPLQRGGVCQNCHGDESDKVSVREEEWLEHAEKRRVSRQTMDKVERELNNGKVFGESNPLGTVCRGCHDNKSDEVSCNDRDWKEHLTRGRVSASVWEAVSLSLRGSTCGW